MIFQDVQDLMERKKGKRLDKKEFLFAAERNKDSLCLARFPFIVAREKEWTFIHLAQQLLYFPKESIIRTHHTIHIRFQRIFPIHVLRTEFKHLQAQ